MAETILVADDEASIRDLARLYLEKEGFRVLTADNGAQALAKARDDSPALLVLDLMMPEIDGWEVCRRLRSEGDMLPILILTARDQDIDKIVALEMGADDYLTKPFAFEELLARIHAVTRRFDQPEASQIRAGALRLDMLAQRVWRDNELIELTAREFALLEYFMRHPNQVLSRQQILFAVWDYDFDPESNIVDVYVRYLRGKIDEEGQPSVITTVRGAGYRFEPGA